MPLPIADTHVFTNEHSVLFEEGAVVRQNPIIWANNEHQLTSFVCRAMGHPVTVRRGDFKTLTCVCGAWQTKIIEDPLPGASSDVLVASLQQRLDDTTRYMRDYRAKLQYLLNSTDMDSFTFPDGDTWYKEPVE